MGRRGIIGMQSNKQNTGIIGATLSKVHFITYNNYTKERVTPPKYLFMSSSKDRYAVIEQSVKLISFY